MKRKPRVQGAPTPPTVGPDGAMAEPPQWDRQRKPRKVYVPKGADALDFYVRPDVERNVAAGAKKRKETIAAKQDAVSDEELYRKRCLDEFEFFCAHEVAIKLKSGEMGKLVLNPLQREIAKEWIAQWRQGKPIREVCLKSRQTGYSTFVAAFFSWLLWKEGGRNAMVLAHDDDATTTLLEMYELMSDAADDLIRPPVLRMNRKRGYALENRSALRVATAGTKQTAAKVGRSKTNQLLHLSELAFWVDPKRTLTGVRATVAKQGQVAVVVESTPNGAAGEFYDLYHNAKRGLNGYKARFVPWHRIDWEYTMSPTADQLRCWDAWRIEGRESARIEGGFHEDHLGQIESYKLTCGQWVWWTWMLWNEYDGDEELLLQEYPPDDRTCFLTSGRPVFPPAHLEELEKHIREPVRCDLELGSLLAQDGRPVIERIENPNGRFAIWEDPVPGAEYLMPADICAGLASKRADRSAVALIKCGTKVEKVAAYVGQPDPEELADMMDLIGRYYFTACAGPEVKSYGDATLRRLLELGYTNVYRRQDWDSVAKEWIRDKLGFCTNGQSRPAAISALKRLLRERRYITHDRDELDELRAFVYDQTSNKEQATKGARDDIVLCICIGARMVEDVGGRPERQAEHHVAVARRDWDKVDAYIRKVASPDEARELLQHVAQSGYYTNWA